MTERRPISDEERPAWESFGEQLISFRNAAGVTQAVLAAAAGIHQTHVDCLEHAKRRTRLSTIRRLAAAIVELSPPDLHETFGAEGVEEALLLALEEHGQAPAQESRFPGHEDRLARLAKRREEKVTLTDLYLRKHAALVAEQAKAVAVDHVLLANERERRRRAEKIGSADPHDPYAGRLRKATEAAVRRRVRRRRSVHHVEDEPTS